MKFWKLVIIFILISLNLLASQNKIESVGLEKKDGKTIVMHVEFSGRIEDTPELSFKDNIVQVEIKNTVVWPKIEKNATSFIHGDTTLMAYQFNKDIARVRGMFPVAVENLKEKAHIEINANRMNVIISGLHETRTIEHRSESQRPVIEVRKTSKTTASTHIEKKDESSYDENYLEQLIKEKLEVASPRKFKDEKNEMTLDKVNSKLASMEKNEEVQDFSFIKYFSKFTFFLLVVLGLFYGAVILLRKGVLKKGKLGFLNDANLVSVLNTTYIAPKKSLLLVKVHKQIFLLSSTDKGVEFLSEVSGATELLREGEKHVTGVNFDGLLGNDHSQAKIKIKEDINISSSDESSDGRRSDATETVESKVKFSEQIKSKIKGMKQLQ